MESTMKIHLNLPRTMDFKNMVIGKKAFSWSLTNRLQDTVSGEKSIK